MALVETPAKQSVRSWILQDWRVNSGYADSQLVLAWFRAAQLARYRWGPAGRLFCAVYRIFTSLFFSVELPPELSVGARLRIFHPHGVVLNPAVVMGSDCVLRHNVTVGNVVRRDGSQKGVASVGNGVEFGAGCVVVGPIHVGDEARIAALALVVVDVPERGVMMGNPATLVRIDDKDFSQDRGGIKA